MRKLVYYVASTLDGFIAHEDGSFDGFVWDDEFVAEFMESLKAFDTVLMGRKTYDVGLKDGKTSPYPDMKQYVFSRTMTSSPDAAVTLVSDDLIPLVTELKQQEGKEIWLCGGAELASQLFEASLIDELKVKVNPVLFGNGIALVSPQTKMTSLQLTDTKPFNSGIVILSYKVQQ